MFSLDCVCPSLRTQPFLLQTLHSPSYLICWLPRPLPLHASHIMPINPPPPGRGLLARNPGRRGFCPLVVVLGTVLHFCCLSWNTKPRESSPGGFHTGEISLKPYLINMATPPPCGDKYHLSSQFPKLITLKCLLHVHGPINSIQS